MSRFRRTRAGIEVRLSPAEAAMLRRLLGDLLELLGEADEEAAPADPLEAMLGSAQGPQQSPEDPVLARLFPDAYTDDAAASAEYRGLMDGELRTTKLSAARSTLDSLEELSSGKLRLDDATAQAWLLSINDLRLSLGTRLEVTEELADQIEALPEDDPRLPGLTAYLWLGWLQETLLDAYAG